jgi:hypothetical protein
MDDVFYWMRKAGLLRHETDSRGEFLMGVDSIYQKAGAVNTFGNYNIMGA